jgi:hypothetical protein
MGSVPLNPHRDEYLLVGSPPPVGVPAEEEVRPEVREEEEAELVVVGRRLKLEENVFDPSGSSPSPFDIPRAAS